MCHSNLSHFELFWAFSLVVQREHYLLYHPFFRYLCYFIRGRQLATDNVTKHPRFRKGAVINGSGVARVPRRGRAGIGIIANARFVGPMPVHETKQQLCEAR